MGKNSFESEAATEEGEEREHLFGPCQVRQGSLTHFQRRPFSLSTVHGKKTSRQLPSAAAQEEGNEEE